MLLDTPSLTIQYNAQEEMLVVHWIGPHDAESVRQDCGRMLESVRRTGCRKILNDSSEAFGEWWPLAAWIGQEFLPELSTTGVQALAWVNSMDWPSRFGVATTMLHARGPQIRIFDFDQQEEARQWLLTLPV
ncbi:SpoIIAA family protein [Hymenobacter pini]|uniref:STAS/SEC14 domain-containing protein n=1 Tax=Hymenobacter pini TaxID=2880879 RepID=UPI001CF2773E|nr:STAS/SEC14 domain-containing protein [Hymenobacter pini]MCA8829742.1 STAS/SEC14 domain-containing protein [Hymenobacter pini]